MLPGPGNDCNLRRNGYNDTLAEMLERVYGYMRVKVSLCDWILNRFLAALGMTVCGFSWIWNDDNVNS